MTAFDWQAQWIWAAPTDATRHFYFRRTFDLPACPEEALLYITADDRYRVCVNEHLLGHGPLRSKPSRQSYDEYYAGSLKPGRNVITVLATHYGIGTAYSCIGRPGLLAQLDMTLEDGSTRTIGTDSEWKCLSAPYEIGFERMCIMLAYPEVVDLRREPAGWHFPDFDDSDWASVQILGPVGIEPWIELERNDFSSPAQNNLQNVRVLQRNRVVAPPPNANKKRTPAEDMELATRLQTAPPDAITSALDIAPQFGSAGVSAVLDFGKEVSGFPFIVIKKSGGGRIDIGYSERLEPDGTVNPNRWGGPPVHYADRLILRSGEQYFYTLDPRAFRYVRLDFYDNPEPLEVCVSLLRSGYRVAEAGDFQCSDALLNRIWETGRYTTELCMDDAFMDCPWRERGQYLGDLAVEMRIAAYAFGDTQLARRGLAQFPLGADAKGWFPGVYPAEPPWEPVLPTFCFLWLVALWDYFLLSGDRTLLEEAWPAVDRLTRTMSERDDDGLLTNLPAPGFVDHAPVQDAGQSTAVNAFAVWGLQAAGRIARTIGIPGRGGELEILASDIGDSLNDRMWDNGRGAYIDGYRDGQPNPALSEHSNILCALVGVADTKQTARILDGVLADSDSEIIRMASPYFAYYYLRLLFKNNRHEQALQFIRKRWGAMLEAGATTFWEMWEPSASLCHAWSASPTFDFMADIAGIRPTQPGFEEFTVHPQPRHLTWLRAVVPTPKGDIVFGYHRRFQVNRRNPNGPQIPQGLTINLTVPPETLADVRVPLPENARASVVRVNDLEVWNAGRPLPGSSKYRRDGDTFSFSAAAGTYHIEIDPDA